MIRNMQAVGLSREAVALDFGDLAREGVAVRRAAEAAAATIVEDARAERRRLLEGARQEGLEAGKIEGFKAGLAAGTAQGVAAAMTERAGALRELEAAWSKALGNVERERVSGMESLRTDGIRLAIGIAERIVRGTLAIEPARVLAIAEGAIAEAARASDLVVVHHPEDARLLGDALPALLATLGGSRGIRLAADPATARGAVRVTSAGGGSVDASVETQLARLSECLLPETAGAARVGP